MFTKVLTTLIPMMLIVLLVVLLVGSAVELRVKQDRACVAAGGHYINQPWTSNECWAPDGTHRLFPEGF